MKPTRAEMDDDKQGAVQDGSNQKGSGKATRVKPTRAEMDGDEQGWVQDGSNQKCSEGEADESRNG